MNSRRILYEVIIVQIKYSLLYYFTFLKQVVNLIIYNYSTDVDDIDHANLYK